MNLHSVDWRYPLKVLAGRQLTQHEMELAHAKGMGERKSKRFFFRETVYDAFDDRIVASFSRSDGIHFVHFAEDRIYTLDGQLKTKIIHNYRKGIHTEINYTPEAKAA